MQVFRGENAINMYVLHSCSNKKCINPEHLYLSNKRNYTTIKNPKTKKRENAQRLSVDVSIVMYECLKDIIAKRNCTMSKFIRRIIYNRIKLEEKLK